MRSKVLATITLSLLLFFSSCNKGYVVPPDYNSINTAEELVSFIQGLNVEIDLTDGKTLRLMPYFSSPNSTNWNFSHMSNGFNYTESKTLTVSGSTGEAKLKFNYQSYNFSKVVRIQVKDLIAYYNDIIVNPSMYNWIVYLLIDDSSYTDAQVILANPREVSNYIELVIDPGNYFNKLTGAFYTYYNRLFYMNGNYQVDNMKFECTGDIYHSGYSYQMYEFYLSIEQP